VFFFDEIKVKALSLYIIAWNVGLVLNNGTNFKTIVLIEYKETPVRTTGEILVGFRNI
jgi:hypothetical protein